MVINTVKGKKKSSKKHKGKLAKQAVVKMQAVSGVSKVRRRVTPIRKVAYRKKGSKPYTKLLSYLNMPHTFNILKGVRLFSLCRLSQLSLLAYIVLYKLFVDKFLGLARVSKFIGKSQLKRRKKKKRWAKIIKIKAPYFYLNKSRSSTISKTYTKLKLYKLF